MQLSAYDGNPRWWDWARQNADAAIRVDRKYDPTLTLIYLPHLDYGLQKWGLADVRIAREVQDLDRVTGQLIDHYRSRGARILISNQMASHSK